MHGIIFEQPEANAAAGNHLIAICKAGPFFSIHASFVLIVLSSLKAYLTGSCQMQPSGHPGLT